MLKLTLHECHSFMSLKWLWMLRDPLPIAQMRKIETVGSPRENKRRLCSSVGVTAD